MPNHSAVPPLGGRYGIDVRRPLPGAAGGLSAVAAGDRLEPGRALMAVRLGRMAPARAEAIAALAPLDLSCVLLPRAVGGHPDDAGKLAGWLICDAPPGPDLQSAGGRWSESEIIDAVLRPAAAGLLALSEKGITHRAIRLDNLFRPGAGHPVILGCAWAAPPAARQPALFEPPGSAVCAPAARGDGAIADDVYALGVVMLALYLGRLPLAGLDDAAILERKQTLGSHAALTNGERIPQALLELTSGMLADDPDHRPAPALLLNPSAARVRRVAARPPRKAQRGFEIGGEAVWTTRALADSLGRHPSDAARELRSRSVDRWLRHGLGDATLAARLGGLVDEHHGAPMVEDPIADGILVLRVIVMLDPQSPLWWRGAALWPDALGAMLADGGFDGIVQELISHEILGAWGAIAPDRVGAAQLQVEGRRLRALLSQRGAAGGLSRLRYALNALLPCASPLLDGAWVTDLSAFAQQFERIAGAPGRPTMGAMDEQIGAFLVARMPHGADGEIARMSNDKPLELALAQLRVLSRVQEITAVAGLPNLAAWFAELCRPAIDGWCSRQRVRDVEAALPDLVGQGHLGRLLAVFDDPARDRRDDAARDAVRDKVRRIDDALRSLQAGRAARRRRAQALGGEMSVGLGAVALAGVLCLWMV